MSLIDTVMIWLLGWRGALLLLLLYISVEISSAALGSGFWWVTFHFILMPIFSACHIFLTLRDLVKNYKKITLPPHITSLAVPSLIIYLSFSTAGLFVRDYLGIVFSK